MNHVYVLIMAGGEGTRFQPLSTPARPKQFINIVGDKALIRQTFERMRLWHDGCVPLERFFVATNARFIDLVHKEIPEIPVQNIIGEPLKKNTAPCIGYAAHVIFSCDPNAVMICLPSDHVITKQREFYLAVDDAVKLAAGGNNLVAFGIKPTRPATEYGYIEKTEDAGFGVKQFVEKPDEETAKHYLSSGNYFWNSGMFVWKAKTILDEISKHLPELSDELSRLKRSADAPQLINFFENAPSISIDYGVMERSKNVAILPCDIGWSDVGSWKSLKELADSGVVAVAPDVKKAMEDELK